MSLSIEKFLRLPTLPTVAVEVIRLFDDPNSSMDQVTAVIRNDPAIAAKILKTANSAQYGGRGTVSDLKRAITLLGRNAVTPLVLSFSLCQQSVSSHENAVHFKQFWLRSFVQATAAEVIAAMFGSPALKGECYTTNLLAGVGKLAFLRAEPEKYQQILKRSCEEEVSLIALESEILGLNHFKLSSVLLGQIGLPARCVSAILSLAPNGRNAPTGSDQEQRLVLITRAANSVASLLCDFDQGVSIITLEETLEELNLPTEVSSEELLSLVQDRIDATAEMFDINPRNFPPATEILQDALDQLSRFSVVATQNPTASDIPSELLQENGRLKRRVADLLRLSSTDALTGAFNRGYFLQILAERTALHRVRREMLGLAVIDLDHFKRVNDTYGHQAG
ncbi:MAG: HDOD domain-containing protein, partial [Planctomycetaceae bacterium]|nr:HDOD domain-containing protein [Planctomycetaceae bacterium]